MVINGARLMPKFTLIGEHTDLQGNPDGSKMTYEFHCDYLPEVLEHFQLFIRGCGFVPDGTLDFVPDDAEVSVTQAGIDALAAFYGYTRGEDFTGDGHDGMGSTAEMYDSQDVLNKSPHYFDTERNK